jgi:hypothetical protein
MEKNEKEGRKGEIGTGKQNEGQTASQTAQGERPE